MRTELDLTFSLYQFLFYLFISIIIIFVELWGKVYIQFLLLVVFIIVRRRDSVLQIHRPSDALRLRLRRRRCAISILYSSSVSPIAMNKKRRTEADTTLAGLHHLLCDVFFRRRRFYYHIFPILSALAGCVFLCFVALSLLVSSPVIHHDHLHLTLFNGGSSVWTAHLCSRRFVMFICYLFCFCPFLLFRETAALSTYRILFWNHPSTFLYGILILLDRRFRVLVFVSLSFRNCFWKFLMPCLLKYYVGKWKDFGP